MFVSICTPIIIIIIIIIIIMLPVHCSLLKPIDTLQLMLQSSVQY